MATLRRALPVRLAVQIRPGCGGERRRRKCVERGEVVVAAAIAIHNAAGRLAMYAALMEGLIASGELIVSHALADPSLSRRVSVQEGRTLTTDGPFAEAKELLAGFVLVECESIERAIEHAARVPEAALGLVEVRPVMEFEM